MEFEPLHTRNGLPRQLEQETYEALRPIYLKYLKMNKRHMSRYRIVGVMYTAFTGATIDEKYYKEEKDDN